MKSGTGGARKQHHDDHASWAAFPHSQCASVDVLSSVFSSTGKLIRTYYRKLLLAVSNLHYRVQDACVCWRSSEFAGLEQFFAYRCWLTPCNTSCLALQLQRKVFLLLFEVCNLRLVTDIAVEWQPCQITINYLIMSSVRLLTHAEEGLKTLFF